MGAIAGILICDYWVIRKQQLNLAALFDPKGPYSTATALTGGRSWRCCGHRSGGAGFLRAATTPAGRSAIRPSSITCTLMRGSLLLPGIRHILRLNTRSKGDSLNATHVKCGLIQCSNAAPTDLPIEEIKRLNIEKHLKFIEQAAKQGVQIICMQEVFHDALLLRRATDALV